MFRSFAKERKRTQNVVFFFSMYIYRYIQIYIDIYRYIEIYRYTQICKDIFIYKYILQKRRLSSFLTFFARFDHFFINIFIGLFHTFLITILRTGSGLELSPLRAACCQSLLLHWRTLTSSCDSPQQRRHSADVEIHQPLWQKPLQL